jgi:hypothetical protein
MIRIPEHYVIGPVETEYWRVYDADQVDAELERVRYERDVLRDQLIDFDKIYESRNHRNYLKGI